MRIRSEYLLKFLEKWKLFRCALSEKEYPEKSDPEATRRQMNPNCHQRNHPKRNSYGSHGHLGSRPFQSRPRTTIRCLHLFENLYLANVIAARNQNGGREELLITRSVINGAFLACDSSCMYFPSPEEFMELVADPAG